MKRKRRPVEVFSLSFLDVISCAFGAIVLVLVIMKISEPTIVEDWTRDIQQDLEDHEQHIAALAEESAELYRTAIQRRSNKEELELRIDALKEKLAEARRNRNMLQVEHVSREAILNRLYLARQELTEDMKRLQAQKVVRPAESPIGGIPVDSEYIIFIIDTSGSMQQFAWPAVQKKMQEILHMYPHVQGIQVMNDMGDYMFSQYQGRWIPDTSARRKAILKRLSSWKPFSNSSPVEGVTAAIRRFYAVDKKISLYIFGDDFSRGTIQQVVDTVDHINRSLTDGTRRVRIHAVGFPVLFGHREAEINVARFSALMRRLAEDNNGSFVGLTTLE